MLGESCKCASWYEWRKMGNEDACGWMTILSLCQQKDAADDKTFFESACRPREAKVGAGCK